MKDENDKANHNKRGRPSQFEQLEIERRLRPLILKGLSPYYAAIETGYSINTVRKYYRKICKGISDLESSEFVQACKDRNAFTCLAMDDQLSKLNKMQQELEKKTPIDETQYIQLYKLRINLVNSILDLLIKKLNIANSPTYDDMLTALRKIGEQK